MLKNEVGFDNSYLRKQKSKMINKTDKTKTVSFNGEVSNWLLASHEKTLSDTTIQTDSTRIDLLPAQWPAALLE